MQLHGEMMADVAQITPSTVTLVIVILMHGQMKRDLAALQMVGAVIQMHTASATVVRSLERVI